MDTYDMSIHRNPDARAWAKFYTETRAAFMAKHPDGQFDNEDNMHGWFANAMMAMHDFLLPGSAPVVLPDGSAVFVADVGGDTVISAQPIGSQPS